MIVIEVYIMDGTQKGLYLFSLTRFNRVYGVKGVWMVNPPKN